MLSAHDVAEYFLARDDENSGELISNLKLQKLAYYAQGVCLAAYDKPLFVETIEAWTHGPVVPSLYHEYKKYGDGKIESSNDFDADKFDAEATDVLEVVYSTFAQYSAWKLRNMTHEEPPWKTAYAKSPGSLISNSSMTSYFKTIVSVDED